MFGFGKREERVKELVEQTVDRLVQHLGDGVEERLLQFTEVDNLTGQIMELREQKAELEAERVFQLATWETREREIEHKTGLLRTQHEQELKLAKKEAVLDAKEQVHAVKAEEFEARQALIAEQLERTEDLLSQVLERLPDARMTFGRKETAKE